MSDVEIRFCKNSNSYYVSPSEDGPHRDCAAMGQTYKLEWPEVAFYLNKLRTIRELFNKLRTEMSV